MATLQYPLVSCIMVTTAKRRKYIPLALRCWWEQTYQITELIIVTEDDLSDIIPKHPKIRVISCENGATIGKKRNIACEAANGGLIFNLDDDDWYGPNAIRECVNAFRDKMIAVTGFHSCYFYETHHKIARTWSFDKPYVFGSGMCYLKTHWMKNHFLENKPFGEDLKMIEDTPNWLVHQLEGLNHLVVRDHDDNTWNRIDRYGKNWKIVDSKMIQRMLNFYEPTKIALGMISWNDKTETLRNLKELQDEAENLKNFGFDPVICIVDNASDDGTRETLKKVKGVTKIYNKTNRGVAVARNEIVDFAVKNETDFVFFIDCDVTVVPFSVLEMLRWLRLNAYQSYGIGPNLITTNNDSEASKECSIIEKTKPYPHWASLCYGLYFTNIMNKFRSDENYGPGWGMEDNDLAMTIEMRTGLRCFVFDDIKYLHKHEHGSLALLKTSGMDIEKNIKDRYKYAIEKWKEFPEFSVLIGWLIQQRESGESILPKSSHK